MPNATGNLLSSHKYRSAVATETPEKKSDRHKERKGGGGERREGTERQREGEERKGRRGR